MVNSLKQIMNWEEDSYLISEFILFLSRYNVEPSIFGWFSALPVTLSCEVPTSSKVSK